MVMNNKLKKQCENCKLKKCSSYNDIKCITCIARSKPFGCGCTNNQIDDKINNCEFYTEK
jgi:hypothetical protein